MTILEALNMIPDPEIRARAIRNRGNADRNYFPEREVSDEFEAMRYGFNFPETEEGFMWATYYNGRITTWQQAREKYPHLRELPLLSEQKVVTENVEYWKQRCLLAEKCLEESPSDPDITMGQIAAWSAYNEFIRLNGKIEWPSTQENT
nr:hypothetical protein [uncultured Flavobacterium sp.]